MTPLLREQVRLRTKFTYNKSLRVDEKSIPIYLIMIEILQLSEQS